MCDSPHPDRLVTGPLRLSRRTVLRAFVGAGAGVLLSACGGDDFDPFAENRPAAATPPVEADEQSAVQPSDQSSSEQAVEAERQAAVAPVELPEPLVYILPSPVSQGETVLVVVEAPGRAVRLPCGGRGSHSRCCTATSGLWVSSASTPTLRSDRGRWASRSGARTGNNSSGKRR